jgi:hypothetical protein
MGGGSLNGGKLNIKRQGRQACFSRTIFAMLGTACAC